MKTLFELYKDHHGKSSDKWSIYLNTYHDILSSLQFLPINFLEIGVQNGGSLDIWAQYFPKAKNIIGCDINEECALLTYDKKHIRVVIGNSSTREVKEKITHIVDEFDVIIDDGSHDSSDIIKSFLLYFPLIKDDGYYIIEDLHCSYWQDFEGGLYYPYSSMAFLKKLSDIINHEHWGIDKTEKDYLDPFYEHYKCSEFDNIDYSEIHSIKFVNSLCIIQKRKKEKNILGPRVISGELENVVQGHQGIDGSFSIVQEQHNNPWSNKPIFPEMEWEKLTENVIQSGEEIKNHLLTIKKLQQDIIFLKNIEDILKSEVDATYKNLSEKDQIIQRLSYDNHALLTSTSWKITLPLRKIVTELRKIKRGGVVSARVIKNYGLTKSFSRAKLLYRQYGIHGIVNKLKYIEQLHNTARIIEHKNLDVVKVLAEDILTPKVLIIAELSIPQCRKYRVDQKVELFKKLGIEATVVDWTHQDECIEALQHHSLVIFYRVPGYESVDPVFDECERLNLTTLWEVDDLIFDSDILRESKTLQALDQYTYNALLEGADLYKKAMLRCKGAISSTQHLAEAMLEAGSPFVHVIENALDPETIITSQEIPSVRKSEEDGIIRIVYGSGTTTHNVDFLEASDAILHILKENKKVHFRLIGMLDLPDSFNEVMSQVERIELCPYRDYLKVLAECDISIAPLENYIFNYSKSNIKYIEASILAIPSVCSPRPTFSHVINHGENGFLCKSNDEWLSVLVMLVNSAELRHEIGMKAKDYVLQHYSPENIANEQVVNLVKSFKRFSGVQKKNILSVNCLYSPRSFGGATVVAEEINKRFVKNENMDVHVLTSLSEEYASPYKLRRYGSFGHECFGIGLPAFVSEGEQIINNNINVTFEKVLDLVKPDLVHFHSIQGLGITMLDICAKRNILIIVTAHDYWWLYDHQFILSYDKNHKYRGVFIDHDSQPITDKKENQYYVLKKREALSLAHRILSPSQFTQNLYTHEGFDNVVLNKNGVNYPLTSSERFIPGTIRFGYLGGNTSIKGFHLIQSAFKNISQDDAELIIVDNTMNLGFSSFNNNDLANFKNYKVIPAFSQKNMDEFYQNIDVLLYPTQSKESFGLTVREALIRNVWVITSDAGGAAEDIIDGENGFIIPFDNDAEKLEKAIMKTISHFKVLDLNKPVHIPHSHIRSFDEQYNELVDIYLLSSK